MNYDILKEEYNELKEEIEILKNENSKLEDEYEILTSENDKLKDNYDKLKDEYDKLKYEYSENVIIESMKDMKDRYDRLLQTTIPQHRYEILNERYNKIVKYFTTCVVLLEHINKSVHNFDRYVYTSETKQYLNRISNELNITKSILEDCIEN